MLGPYEISVTTYTFLKSPLLLISRNSDRTHARTYTQSQGYMHKPLLSQDKQHPPHPSGSKGSPTYTYVSPALWVPVPTPTTLWSTHQREITHRLMYTAPGPDPCWLHHAVALLPGCRLLTASDGEAALSGVSRGWDAGRVTSGSAKPGFGSSCFQSKVSPLLLEIFMLLFYFFASCCFVSETSLKFPDYCLIRVMVTFPFNVIGFGHQNNNFFFCLLDNLYI